jgi:hypothetical protein
MKTIPLAKANKACVTLYAAPFFYVKRPLLGVNNRKITPPPPNFVSV